MPAVDCHQGWASFVIWRQAGNWNLWEEEKNLLCFPSILRKNSFPWKLNKFCCLQIRKWNNSVSRLPSNTQCQHCVKRKIFICKCSNKDIIKDLSIWISLQTTFNLSVKSADVYFGRESIRETYFSERKVLRSQKKENEGSKNEESEFFQQDKHFKNFPAMQRLDYSNQPSQ